MDSGIRHINMPLRPMVPQWGTSLHKLASGGCQKSATPFYNGIAMHPFNNTVRDYVDNVVQR